MYRIALCICALLFLGSCHQRNEPFVIMFDSGHTNREPGALGVQGEFEKKYNDTLVDELIALLNRDESFRTYRSAEPDEEISLEERSFRANRISADLFLSIHHNSVNEEKIEYFSLEGRTAARTREDRQGYSLYISAKNPRITDSLWFATALGKRLEEIGRESYSIHSKSSPPAGQQLMNKRYGIFQYDNLAVLKAASMPALLFEVGFIVDEKDDIWLRQHRTEIAGQIVRALHDFREWKLSEKTH
ncbi:MAG: N-acetylmuramoyl-L-alanine amidase [Bdellovibrionales bacterium]|nr:N-acetylmuramoyl-L-alanine amidase [Bdellovibrionales bacterium]